MPQYTSSISHGEMIYKKKSVCLVRGLWFHILYEILVPNRPCLLILYKIQDEGSKNLHYKWVLTLAEDSSWSFENTSVVHLKPQWSSFRCRRGGRGESSAASVLPWSWQESRRPPRGSSHQFFLSDTPRPLTALRSIAIKGAWFEVVFI